MADTVTNAPGKAHLARAKDREYRAMIYASLPIFLVAATMKRMLPDQGAYYGTAPGKRQSIYRDAVAMANTFIPFAFMH